MLLPCPNYCDSMSLSILCRNFHQKVQPESVFLPVLRRDPETSSHTKQERGSESLLLSRVPAEMQPSAVSTEGDSDGWRECWKGVSSSRIINIIVVIERYYCSVAQSCLTLYDPMDCSMPGFPVLHSLLESAQTHVHWINDAIQLSHPLLLLSLPALSLSQHQGTDLCGFGIEPFEVYVHSSGWGVRTLI